MRIANHGDGAYYYIDRLAEADRVLTKELTTTLTTVARDVKIQVEFNPAKVARYRLIAYANRQLQAKDFTDDEVDADDLGAGEEVTALYQIEPGAAAADPRAKMRYQAVSAAPKMDWWRPQRRVRSVLALVSRRSTRL
ncbi:MAG: YfbK domain-containing protein [Verrucomicrobiota bacterium]